MSEEADEQRVEWLPPRAPGAQPPPRFDPDRPDPLAKPPPAPQPPPPPEPSQPQQLGDPFAPPTLPPGARPLAQTTPSQPWPQPYGKAPSNTAAVLSMVCGIGGLVLFVFPAGFGLVFVFNLPCSILAWVFGVRGRRRVDRGETHEHRGMAQMGIVLGVIGTILGAVAIVAWALAIALSPEVRHELSRQAGGVAAP